MLKNKGTASSKILPFVIWLAAVAGVAMLYTQRVNSFTTMGLAVARTQTVSATDSSIIRHIAVKACQPVRKGDVLVMLELGNPMENEYAHSLAEAKKVTARAELERLKSELSAMQEQLSAETTQRQTDENLRCQQLVLDVNRARVSLLENKAALEADRGLLAGLEQEKAMLEELFSKQAVDMYEVQKVRVAYDSLAGKVKTEEELLAQAQTDSSQAQERLNQYTASVPTASMEPIRRRLEPFDKAIAVQEKYMEELIAPSYLWTVKAEFDGIVGSIACAEGQAVNANLPILTVTSPAAEYVTVWLDPQQAGLIREKMPVEIIKVIAPRAVFHAEVASMGSAFELLPEQLWRTAGVPQWGRPVRIPISMEMRLLGNEIVGVHGL
jgi:multidrug resistance efflux pump